MLYPDVNNESNMNNETTAPHAPYQSAPYQAPPSRPRTGRAVAWTMLFAFLFGVIVFGAGWEFGRGSVGE
jgi:hypothetical protein